MKIFSNLDQSHACYLDFASHNVALQEVLHTTPWKPT